jgi:hypothetical protein
MLLATSAGEGGGKQEGSRRRGRYLADPAWRAQMGSISDTMTRAPAAFMAWAEPLPTSPNPAMNTVLDAIITSVARMMPSGRE